MDFLGNFSHLFGDKKKRFVKMREELDYSYQDITLEPIAKVEDKKLYFSIFTIKSFFVLVFCILFFRLFILQVIQGESNQNLAEGNRIRPRIIAAGRGLITDRNGAWLARNKPSFNLSLYPSLLPKDKFLREEIYTEISLLTSVPVNEIKKQSEDNGFLSLGEVVLKDDIPHDEALVMEKKIHGLQGVSITKSSIREYTLIPGLAHLLGYTSKVSKEDLSENPDYLLSDRIGKAGLEANYEKNLKGENGVEQIEVDSKGNIIRILAQEGRREPASGDNITLYLDQGLQKKSAEALLKGIEEAKKALGNDEVNSGVVIVMDTKNGGILSMVSLPDYNNNLFASKISNDDYKKLVEDKSYPMFNRAIKGTYPPGSIVKIVMAAAGLSEKVINVNTSLDTPLEIKIGDFTFPDWKDHGMTNIERAIAESNNIFFYAIGGGFDKIKGIGINKIKKYWQLFGLGEKTSIDLPNESSGLLPDSEWKEKYKKEGWYIGDTYHVSIGQGDLLVTPLQMLRITATIANGGILLQPQLAQKITDNKGNVIKEFGPRVERENFIDPSIIKTIQSGMRMTVTDGSARNLNDLPVSVAGKTGTAQFYNNEKTHAWFECYAPYENPEIAAIVMIEGGGGGHEIAAPVAKEILSYYFQSRITNQNF